MKFTTSSVVALLAAGISAQRPSNIPVCDYYAQQILGNNTITSQRLLLTKLMNTVVLGSFITPGGVDFKQNPNVTVLGIASPGVYNGTKINLLPLFTGDLNSTNLGGSSGSRKLFLDDGGPVPLQAVTPAVGTSSVQYHLLTHIYQYFGTILGCSLQGGPEFPKYQGRTSMYEVHQFMNLDNYQNSFFIWQLQTAALSLNFDRQDVIDFGNTLQKFFNYRCSPATAYPVSAKPEFQSICIAENCPLDPNAGDCKVYPELGVAKIPLNVTEYELSKASASASASVSASKTASASASATAKSDGEVKRIDRVVVGTGLVMALLAGLARI